MKILVTNVYSYKNKGDAAIVIALIREIHRVFKQADVLIQTADIQNDEKKYGEPTTSSLLWILLSSVRSKNLLYRLWVVLSGLVALGVYLSCARLLKFEPRFILSKSLKQYINDNKTCDLAIACGGGYLRTATSGLQDTLLLTVTCLNFLSAHYLGKRVFLYSQSIGPVHGKIQQKILRYTLNKVDLVEPREDISAKYLEELKIQSKIVQTADPVLLLGGTGVFPKNYVQLDSKRLHVGLTVRKWFQREEDLQQYIQSVAATIDYLVSEHNAEVFYAPQVIAENFGDDDRIIAQAVWDKVQNKDRFTVVNADLHPFEVIGLCGAMDIFIGTRMHSNIFSLISGVPVIAIEYEHKTKGIMRGLGLDALTIDIQKVTDKTLKQKVDLLLSDRPHYQGLIKQNMPAQIQKSKNAIEVILQEYETDVN